MCGGDFFVGDGRKKTGHRAEVYIFVLCSYCARFEPVVSKSCSLKSRSTNIYTSALCPVFFLTLMRSGSWYMMFIG